MADILSRELRLAAARSLGPITGPLNQDFRTLRRIDSGSYAGIPCVHHPDDAGLRRLADRMCYSCRSDRRKAEWAFDPKVRQAHAEKVKRLREAKDLNMRNAKVEAEICAIADHKLEPAAWIEYASAEVINYFFPEGVKS
jgi:hypothetical protein